MEKILKIYNLPVKIYCPQDSLTHMQNEIYQNLFLDKKRIGSVPRYIRLKKLGNTTISNLEDDTLINETIYYHLN